MKTKLKIILRLAALVFVLDHLTKALVDTYLPLGSEVTIINGFFDLVHGRNTGAAFGVLSGWDSPWRNLFFYGIGVLACVFLYQYAKTIEEEDKISLSALGLILGGALGNLTDRFWRGSVVDFLSFHINNKIINTEIFGYHVVIPLTWPAFNVADIAITCAVVLLIIQNLRMSFVESQASSPE
ncbi:MAG: signal peptidase II [Deltaproteobacteria bacterium]|nr:signal peptidase II [Deltaproteobacteria bacterium]